MTTVQNVSEYLNAIGVEHDEVQLVGENEATAKVGNVEALVKALEAAGFSQYNYNDSIISSKEDFGYILIDDTYRQENHYRHKELNAYVMVVEHPYRSADNYIHLSNESLAPKNWFTAIVEQVQDRKEEIKNKLTSVKEKINLSDKLESDFSSEKIQEIKTKLNETFNKLKEKFTK